MILLELSLDDVGIFAGHHRVDLSVSPNKPIVLFGGLNGRGKTTILEALQLGLYGRRAPFVRNSDGSYDAILNSLVNRNSQSGESQISLRFEIVEGGLRHEYRIDRWWSREARRGARDNLRVWLDDVPDELLSDRWDDFIESILPVAIAELFLFDGEQIESLADPSTSAHVIEVAIVGILGVGLVDRLAQDLKAIQRRWQLDEALPEVQAEIRLLEAELDTRSSEVAMLVQERAAIQNQLDLSIRRKDQALFELSQGGGDLAERRSELEEERQKIEEERRELESELQSIYAGEFPFSLIPELLSRTAHSARIEYDCAVERIAASRISEARKNMIVQIDSADLDEHAQRIVIDAIERSLTVDDSSRSSAEYLHWGLREVTTFIELASDLNRELDYGRQLATQLENVSSRLTEIGRFLDSIPPEETIRQLLERAERSKSDVADRAKELADFDNKISSTEALARSASDRIDRILERHSSAIVEAEDVARMREFSLRSIETLANFKEALITRQIGQIAEHVTESFRELLGKDDLVERVEISPRDFTIQIWNSDERVIPAESLSAGERQILAIALLWGLAKASGRRFPMAIDTPLGRLDSTHRRTLIDSYFPYASDQLILLSTDEEISPEQYSALEPSISSSYLISYDPKVSSSCISTGYFDKERV